MSDLADRAQAQMEQIAELRQRYERKPRAEVVQGDVRFCEDCGEQIPEKRVRILPYCVRCVDCQELAER
ncbi:TraR/DksA C4-type zinc finger protein [Testudinibacter sp. P27/CKL/0425]